eukprot:335490-Pyramimonas_sp.AAC.1
MAGYSSRSVPAASSWHESGLSFLAPGSRWEPPVDEYQVARLVLLERSESCGLRTLDSVGVLRLDASEPCDP